MNNYLTYLYLLTPLHTGGSANEGNLMGIAREVHTEFPYLPASSLRGKIRAELEAEYADAAAKFFGQKIKDGQQPTEGEVWFADATLLFFPIASLSHHLVWITCPLWLERWNRWIGDGEIAKLIAQCNDILKDDEPADSEPLEKTTTDNKPVLNKPVPNKPNPPQPVDNKASDNKSKSAIVSFETEELYLQTAILTKPNLEKINFQYFLNQLQELLKDNSLISNLGKKLIVLTDEDCAALVEIGLQREVRVALEEESKTVKGGSFRSEEAIPPEAVLFFPWGIKPPKKFEIDTEKTDQQNQEEKIKKDKTDTEIRQEIQNKLNKQKLQFGGLESLGRGWAELRTVVNTINQDR
ncbi:type III-B CRISPR module RAMP protein Cmr4 [Nostoc sp. TCL26-01]|uniref:type III-B CRISPR module RAMP protein Cmr4 n=1 Tax=Nostoc sp. TCL26-01 TaxID=2576904 RepID=UPI0015BCBAB4|nr:type III-B CRISPR module RAMP protein Cmr4 [Nostoc sp. TCL26-01]QLE59757.1 type III-B CRISPR module RAMP protein Cmr4 [Nostoc sp. TCL26-01]